MLQSCEKHEYSVVVYDDKKCPLCLLQKEYNDLVGEFNDLKSRLESELQDKENEIDSLKSGGI